MSFASALNKFHFPTQQQPLHRSISFFKRNELAHLKKTLNLPKQSANSFALYYKDLFAQSGGLREQVLSKSITLKEAVQQASQKWRAETEEVRQKYQQLATKNKEAYLQEKNSTLQSMNQNRLLLLQSLKELPKAGKFRSLKPEVQKLLMEIPRAPPADGKLLFVREKFKEASGGGQAFAAGESAAFLKEVVQKWNCLDESAQIQYNQKAEMLWRHYESELSVFLSK